MNANVLASAHQASLHTDMLMIGGVAPCTKQEVYETASQIKEFNSQITTHGHMHNLPIPQHQHNHKFTIHTNNIIMLQGSQN